MPELLIELGCEELPASFVRKAVSDLSDSIQRKLGEARLSFEGVQTYCTPRRLIVSVSGIPDVQPDETREVRGPAVKAAFDAFGAPSKALEGFCKGQGVDVATVRTEGDYVWITKHVTGQPTREVLAGIVSSAITSLTFDKTMRWANYKLRFARPIRWIVCAFNSAPVEFEIEGVSSGITSRGHRFNAPDAFEATSIDRLVSELRNRQVEPDPEARRTRIIQGAVGLTQDSPILTDALVDENVFLTEWPTPLMGEFDEQYLALPDFVLMTVMAKHEKFFPVRGSTGQIVNQFISVRNGGQEETVRNGNRWVLGCRFNDSMFFFEEDKKRTLSDFLESTSEMTFQEKLGSVRKRADRLARLSAFVAKSMGLSEEAQAWAKHAGLLAKADLSSGLVGELASLQGLVGGEYARREGTHPHVCHAIATHYDHTKNLGPASEEKSVALSVSVADQLDKMAGYLGLGMTPTGSSDPYGLRRSAGILVEVSLDQGWDCDLSELLSYAVDGFEESASLNRELVISASRDLILQRYQGAFAGHRPDVLEAALSGDDSVAFQPFKVQKRVNSLNELVEDVTFVQTATRPINIVGAAEKKGIVIGARNDDKLDCEEGTALAKALENAQVKDHLVSAAKDLSPAINSFFNRVMVMVEDESVRDSRLSLLKDVSSFLLQIGDFSKIVVE